MAANVYNRVSSSSPLFVLKQIISTKFIMSDQSHSELLANFISVTGVSSERATFYLESAAWKLEVALGSFYEEDHDDPGSAAGAPMEEQPSPTKQTGAAGQSAQPKPKSRFGTIGSLQGNQSDSSDDDPREAFYTGGSEHGGGQQILGPPTNKKETDKFVQDMFKSAKEHGAEEVDPAEASSSQARPKPQTFTGSGYRLGETEGPSEEVAGAAVKPKQKDVVLKLWQKGFTVDDGPLRNYHESPENRDFIRDIQQGHVPKELLHAAQGGEVNLNMEDHREEEYVPTKQKMKAFTGQGHTLGSPAPEVFEAPPASSGASSSPPQSAIVVNDSSPTTTLQIRLADGSRMTAKFNHTHTVGDVRQHILSLHPQYTDRTFVLMTTFPSKELSDMSQSLSDAQLINAVLVQRMK